MAGNNMRASCIKDIYSGKYPVLRGKIDRIMQMFGHTPETAMRYYRRFCRDDYADVTSPILSNETVAESDETEILKNACDIQAVKNPVKQGEKGAYLEQGITSLKTKTPCFQAPNAVENKGHNSKYTPQDSNL